MTTVALDLLSSQVMLLTARDCSLLIILSALLWGVVETRKRRREHNSLPVDDLPDETFMQLPNVQNEYCRRIYEEKSMNFQNYDKRNESHEKLQDHCPEKLVVSLVPERMPICILHRRCDFSINKDNKCINSSTPTSVCKERCHYHKVLIGKRYMFQIVYTGCFCSNHIGPDQDDPCFPKYYCYCN